MKKRNFFSLHNLLILSISLSTTSNVAAIELDSSDDTANGALSSIAVDLSHLRRSSPATFNGDNRDRYDLDTPPKFYTQLDVCTTYEGITRCQNVAKSGLGEGANNNTHTGTRGDLQSGGMSAHTGAAKINLDSMFTDYEAVDQAEDQNREDIVKELKARLKKQKKTPQQIEAEIIKMDEELLNNANTYNYIQASIIERVPGVGLFGSEWSRPAGCMSLAYGSLSNLLDQPPAVTVNFDDKVKNDRRGCYSVKIDDEYYDNRKYMGDKATQNPDGWSSGEAWGMWEFRASSLPKEELIALVNAENQNEPTGSVATAGSGPALPSADLGQRGTASIRRGKNTVWGKPTIREVQPAREEGGPAQTTDIGKGSVEEEIQAPAESSGGGSSPDAR